MNEREHVLNAVLLALGIAVLVAPTVDAVPRTAAQVGVPVVLGALVPDLDATFGSHRKTLHNLATLGVFAGFPFLFGNLAFVWIGVLTHYVLDLLGNVRGMALLYPLPEEYDVPVGVTVDSRWATVVTLAVTGVELLAVEALLRAPVAGGPWVAGLFPV
ncbi:MAG: metal-dependent hydrolase [Halanaeroarchaeum sp.]